MFSFLFILFFLVVIINISNNLVLWWSVFLILTLLFLIIIKKDFSFKRIVGYFLIQEVCGLLFLIITYDFFQLFLVFIKTGVSPFHFWIFSVLNDCVGFNLLWFLTFQKIPYLLTIIYLFVLVFIFVLFLGVLFCFIQIFIIKNFKNIIIINSTESFSWVLLSLVFTFFEFFQLFSYYVLIFFILLPYINFSFLGFRWELVLFILNIPLSLNFFVKFLSLSFISFLNFYFLLVLFLIFLSVVGFSYFIIKNSVSFYKIFGNNINFLFVFFSLSFLFFMCYFSNYKITLPW